MDEQKDLRAGEEPTACTGLGEDRDPVAGPAPVTFYNAVPVGYLVLDDKGLILEANPASTRMLDRACGDLIGQPLNRFVVAEDREPFATFWQRLVAGSRTGRVEVRLVSKDGSRFVARIEGHRFGDGGASDRQNGQQPYGLTITDVSEWVQAERELQQAHDFIAAVLNTAGALIIVVDSQGRIVRFNRACEDISGYRFDQVKGQPVWEIFGHSAARS